jgi:hypothetical protein
MKNKGKRHLLLLFRQKYHSHKAVYFFAALAAFGLYLFIYLGPADAVSRIPWSPKYDWIVLAIATLIALLFVFRLVASRIPYVQCTELNIRIQTPFLPVVISYARVRETRPNALFEIFKRDKVSRREARFLEKISGQTAIVVDVNSLPMSIGWLKFWMSNLMFTPGNDGLVLWVEDWMTLNRELADFKDRWRERHMSQADSNPYNRIAR